MKENIMQKGNLTDLISFAKEWSGESDEVAAFNFLASKIPYISSILTGSAPPAVKVGKPKDVVTSSYVNLVRLREGVYLLVATNKELNPSREKKYEELPEAVVVDAESVQVGSFSSLLSAISSLVKKEGSSILTEGFPWKTAFTSPRELKSIDDALEYLGIPEWPEKWGIRKSATDCP